MKSSSLLWQMTLILGFLGNAFALGGTDGFSNVSSAGVLPHTAYQIFGELGWHRVPITSGGAASSVFPWVTGIRMGLFNRGEFGVELGEHISLSGKVQFIKEEDWLPSCSFGGRQIFNSQEAHFYSVPDSLRDPYAGELFMAISKSFFKSTVLNGGVSIIPGIDSGRAQPFWGISQGLFSGLSILYDGFKRQSELHHNLGFGINYRDVLRISLGATEVERFFYQNAQFGFYTSNREASDNSAYRAPGLWCMISVTGFMKEGMRAKTEDRVAALEKKLDSHTKQMEKSEQRVDRIELQVQSLQKGGTDSVALREALAERMLADLVKSMLNESWDPRESRRLQDSLLELGEVSARLLVRTMLRESSVMDYRLTSVRVMSTSKSLRFVQALTELLDQNVPELQREALFALANIGSPECFAAIRNFRVKATPELQKTVDEVMPPAKSAPAPIAPTAPAIPVPAVPAP